MKTIIAGSRSITDSGQVDNAIAASGFHITEVVCGGAQGVDELGNQWASAHKLPVTTFLADWDKHGKRAGPLRNEAMAQYAEAAIIVWDGISRGTADMIVRAKRHQLKLFIQHGR